MRVPLVPRGPSAWGAIEREGEIVEGGVKAGGGRRRCCNCALGRPSHRGNGEAELRCVDASGVAATQDWQSLGVVQVGIPDEGAPELVMALWRLWALELSIAWRGTASRGSTWPALSASMRARRGRGCACKMRVTSILRRWRRGGRDCHAPRHLAKSRARARVIAVSH